MKKSKQNLNYIFHNPNTPEKTLEMLKTVIIAKLVDGIEKNETL